VGAEEHLGRSPIEGARVPRGPYWLRVEKEGCERLAGLFGTSYPEPALKLSLDEVGA
jgi:hypothetical protein